MKKLLALLLALALMFSTVTAAFAEEAISDEAEILKQLKVLKGDGKGVTAEYLATTPTRLQAAIMFLRLKGLEEDALAWTETTETFVDADQVLWAEGKNVLAYLKAHPELGWIGTDGAFKAQDKMSAQAYAKVMLEALGYKQNTAEVIGDFTWAGVFEFAAQVGLNVANSETFTLNELATATVAALVTPVKGGEVALIETLIEVGVVDAEVAVEVGLLMSELELAIAAAVEAIEALPAEITLEDLEAVLAARDLVSAAEELGAEEIAGLDVLVAAEAAIETLENAPKVAAEEAIAALPAEITLEHKAHVEEVRALVDAAEGFEIAGLDTLVAAEAKIVELEAAAAEVAKALEVESVSATNLREIYVKFSKAVDKTTAETAANYTLSAGAVGTATLGADGMTVTLKLAAAAGQQASVDVTVENVKDTFGNKITKVKKTVAMLDQTLPQIVSVEVTGPRTLKLTFSEPMLTSGTAVLDNGVYYVTVPAMTAGSKTLNLTLGLSLPAGAHTLVLKNFVDEANFKTLNTTLTFDYAADTTAPTASVKSATESVITLTFDKAVKATNINTDVTAYHTYNSVAAYKGTLAAVNADVNGYASEYTVTFTTPVPAGTHTLYLNAAANKFEDQWGNDFVTSTVAVEVITDVVKPTATVAATADNVIEVTFSEDVTELSAETKANYVFLDATGAVITNHGGLTAAGNPDGSATMVYTSATKKLVITLDTALTGGTYAVKIANIKDKAFVVNTMDEATIAFSVTDSTRPTLTKALVNTARTEIMVYFSEPMNAEGMTTTTNYYYILDGAAVASLPTGSTVAIVDTKTVKITLGTALAASFVAGGNDFVVVSGSLKDVTGNTIGGLSTQVATTGDTILLANISKVKFNSLTNVTFEVDRELGAIDVTKFTIDGTLNSVTGATYVNGSGKSTVTLTIDKSVEDIKDDLSGITGNAIEIAASALTSAFGTANAGAINVAKAAGTQDGIKPVLDTYEMTAVDTIVLTYSEAIKATTVSLYTYTVAGNTVSNIAVGGAGNKVVTITLDENESVNATPSLTQALDIEDANGNKLAASGAITIADKVAPDVDAANSYAVDTDNDGKINKVFIKMTENVALQATIDTQAKAATLVTALTVHNGTADTDLTASMTGIALASGTEDTLEITLNDTVVGTGVVKITIDADNAGYDLTQKGSTTFFALDEAATAIADKVAPVVVLAATTPIAGNSGTDTVVFSEAINAASQTAVEAAITAGVGGTAPVLGYGWVGQTLTITNTGVATPANDATFAADITVGSITDGTNATSNVTVVDVP